MRLLCFIWYPGDEIRRVLVETVIPFAKELFISGVEKKRGRKGFIPDTILAEYDQFDDYLEMVIQFGVSTTCFSSCQKVVVLCGAVCLCDLAVGVSVCVCACHFLYTNQVPVILYVSQDIPKELLPLFPQYITLFASAFPLGGAVTFVFLYIEVRSDFFKLLHAYRRPQPRM